jgi:four helix bundle protein
MGYKFEKLEVWRLALDYLDMAYSIAAALPRSEEYNLPPQLRRAATSVCLNIAEGSTSQTDPEQARFVGMAVRSLVETVACLNIIQRRAYVEAPLLQEVYGSSEKLFAKLQAFRSALSRAEPRPASYRRTGEEQAEYIVDTD